ncbi:MAG: sugar transferase [Pseudomonadota bacterium]
MRITEHYDTVRVGAQPVRAGDAPRATSPNTPPSFWAFKRLFDIVLSVLLLPVLALAALGLMVLNPFFNRGPLIYIQERMGRDLRPFRMVKFRSMTKAADIARGANDPVEKDRITRLGGLIRKLRIDELPQILNVLKGDMSLIGPRPEYVPHALSYARNVRGYDQRYSVRPGISGLAQVEQGYTDCDDGVRGKLRYDLRYIRGAGFRMESYVFMKTLRTVLTGFGAR